MSDPIATVPSALERLRVAGAKVPTLSSPYPLTSPLFGPPCSVGELDELQQGYRGAFGALPSDYVEWLGLCRRVEAGDVHNGYFLFSPLGTPTDGPRCLQVPELGVYEEVWVRAIGGDGGGNLFLMATSAKVSGFVWKWDHERPPRFDGMAKDGLTLVARSFTGFLARVAEDWEHFVAEDRGWQYLAG